MTDRPLYVSFLWHMHQPFYKDPETSLYRLPWVRLHGTKDYLDMVDILTEFPHIKQTFNITPSLLEQIIDYTDNNALDPYLELTMKPAADLDMNERLFILDNFFLANWDTMIKPLPRYHELLMKRGSHFTPNDLIQLSRSFSHDDFRDLQVLFNLCWIDPLFRDKDPFLKTLVDKARAYTEEEKDMLISKQRSILQEIIPRYRETAQKGQIELSVSPFYHPILPLLCNTGSARDALPDMKLPRMQFAHPEDAEKQIRMGIDYFENVFGYKPQGMWPSEGSVSEEVLRLLSREGIHWIGTDEDILSLSLGKQLRSPAGTMVEPELLYNPYVFKNVSIIFRDHSLSDLIGFVYSQWDPQKAAEDFISRLIHIKNSLPHDRPHIVSIILDGENAWEYYQNDGQDFLRFLYEGISKEAMLETITISEYLHKYDTEQPLDRLHAGSWIYANFGTWIGHEEKNRAWEFLSEARDNLESYQRSNPDKDLSDTWRALYIAEGSDWTWWYGDDHRTDDQEHFDDLFRLNLMKIYTDIGKDIQDYLMVPVRREDISIQPVMHIKGFIDPKLDGFVSSYSEWYHAAYIDIKKTGGSMHKAESILASVYYGFNKDTLFLRIDPSVPFTAVPGLTLSIHIVKPSIAKIIVSMEPALTAELFMKREQTWEKIKDISDVAAQDIFEMAVSFYDLAASERDEIALFIDIAKNNEPLERCPWKGYITCIVPSPDFESTMWY
jgi:alpha-amylase/alpha-mannosidase (GH57 family)